MCVLLAVTYRLIDDRVKFRNARSRTDNSYRNGKCGDVREQHFERLSSREPKEMGRKEMRDRTSLKAYLSRSKFLYTCSVHLVDLS